MRILAVAAAIALLLVSTVPADGQVPDRNVNMVSGTGWPGGDPFLQRQNEPSMAVSTRNPLHLIAGANDYRTVDIPGALNIKVIGDAWLGLFRSTDGGTTWKSSLLPDLPPELYGILGRQGLAGADPIVRSGPNGFFYYGGLVFNRQTPAASAIFVVRLFDFNDKEAGDPVRPFGGWVIDAGVNGRFVDKPWMAVDIPRASSPQCFAGFERVQGHSVYMAYTAFRDATETTSDLMFSASRNCGLFFSRPKSISGNVPLNQGAAIAIDPATGAIYVTWRRVDLQGPNDAVMFAKSTDFGETFTPPAVVAIINPFEQGTTSTSFRTTAYPTMAVDHNGGIHVAWSQRIGNIEGGSRIMLASSTNGGANWSAPRLVDGSPARGQQFMPSLAFAGGKLTLVYYDQRQDHTIGAFTKDLLRGGHTESRDLAGDLLYNEAGKVFWNFLADALPPPPATFNAPIRRRHTLDVWAAQADPGGAFATARVSQYIFGSEPGVAGVSRPVKQLQFNPPNLPLFQQGTVPFLGDYLDVAAPAFVNTSAGWRFNVTPQSAPVFHAAWTDNRDVRPPADGNWRNYTPVSSVANTGVSKYDGSTVAPCVPGQTGMRNQNIYTARITRGLFAGSPGNAKPINALERAFVVFVQNTLTVEKAYRLTILNQPPGGRASFLQVPLAGYPNPLTVLDVIVPPRSTVARSVFARSTDRKARIDVDVREITSLAGAPVPDGLQTAVVLNPDIANPDIANPDIANPDIANPDIANAEVYNPDIANPDIANPDIANPDIANPDIANPDIANPDIANPDIANPDIANPDIANPDIANPDIANPDIANPDIANQSMTDTTWTTTNTGNTTASYSVNLLLNGTVPNGFVTQLILHKTYSTPAARGCNLGTTRQTVVLANVRNPEFLNNPTALLTSDITDGDLDNATAWLEPGASLRITLRVLDPNKHDNITFNAAEQVSPVVVSHAINTAALAAGSTTPQISFAILTGRVADAIGGAPYSATLTSAGGVGNKTWSGTGLPPTFTLGANGVVSGATTPPPGHYSFTATVTDSRAPVPQSKSRGVLLRVVAPLALAAQTLLGGSVGSAYPNTGLNRTGGVAPFTWSIVAGSLPPGLTLSPSGTISGTPTTSGMFNFTVRVTDGTFPAAQSAQSAYSIAVIASSLNIVFEFDPQSFVEENPTPNVTLRVTDSSGATLPGVNVTLREGPNACGFVLPPRTVVTNADGRGLFTGLPPLSPCAGYRYRASAQFVGFEPATRDSSLFDVFGFRAFTPMNSGHTFGAAATSLLDGRILVTGGDASRTAEVYDPVSNSWTTVGQMAEAREYHTATLLGDGRVLIAGGRGAGGTYPLTVELFDPSTGTFANAGSLPEGRAEATATRMQDDGVYIIGGYNGVGGGNHLRTAVRWYQGSVSTLVSQMAAGRYAHTATQLPDETIIIIGGGVASNRKTIEYLADGLFGPLGSLQVDRLAATATLLNDGRILVVGGTSILPSGAGLRQNNYEIVYPATGNSYLASTGIGGGRDVHLALKLPDGRVVIGGGRSNDGNIASVMLFNPAVGAPITEGGTEGGFTGFGSFDSPRSNAKAAAFSTGTVTRFVAVGGAATGVEVLIPPR